jgi:hypothetical protein
MHVVVVGAGTVGCLVAWALRAVANVTCTLTDINPRRQEVAERLRIPFAAVDAVKGDAQIVIHTSGSPEGLVRSLDLAAADGTILEMSWYGDRMVSVPLGGAFHSRRLTIKASQVGSIPPALRAKWTHASRLDYAVGLLKDDALDALITGESAFDELPEVMAQLATAPGDTLCHRIGTNRLSVVGRVWCVNPALVCNVERLSTADLWIRVLEKACTRCQCATTSWWLTVFAARRSARPSGCTAPRSSSIWRSSGPSWTTTAWWWISGRRATC